MAGLEIVEGREIEASRQRRCNERAAAALAAVDIQLETEEQGGNEKKNEAVPSSQLGSRAQLFENSSSREKFESEMGFVDLVMSGVRLELSSQSSHRLTD